MTPDPADKSLFRETYEAANRYWFGFGSPTSLGLFRIVFGTLVLCNLVLLSFDWPTWFSEQGFVPAWAGARWLPPRVPLGFGTTWTVPRIDLLNGITDDRLSLLFWVVTVLAALFTTLGIWTRVSSVTLALCVVSLHHRNPVILHGGDTVLRIMCLYLAIAPSGAACSIDRLVGILKGRISSAPVVVSLWPQRLIAYNMALIYLTTTWLKWGGHLWQNGTATYYPARLAEFKRFPVPPFLNDFPVVYFTTYGTLAIEFALGTLVFFRPLRNYVLLSGLLLHAWIDYSMNIPLFSFLMVSMYISFYEGDEIADWAARVGLRKKNWHVNVRVPVGMRLRTTAVSFLECIDPLKLIHYLPGEHDTWSATKHDGTPMPIWPTIYSRSPGAWLVGWYPGFWNRFSTKALEPIITTQQPLSTTSSTSESKSPS